MASQFHINQRLSYSTSLCTVRYIGTVDGTSGEWLGVEWDEPSRGKHSGEHAGKKYFDCIIPNAGSFIRPTRAPDTPLSFVQALRKKYIDTGEEDAAKKSAERPIEWGGKVVQEIGFEKIRQRLRKVKELKIVMLDGLQISKADSEELIIKTCPNIEELDLSRNLFESLQIVSEFCRCLPKLRALRISGNRFASLKVTPGKVLKEGEDEDIYITGFENITSLEVEETLLTWEKLAELLPLFPSLKTLDLTLNRLSSIPSSIADSPFTNIISSSLTEIKLEKNNFTTISSIFPLAAIASLRRLLLAHNKISSISETPDNGESPAIFEHITYLDLSFNAIPSFLFINDINKYFPNVEGLRISHNPLYHVPDMGAEEAHMLTLGRLSWKVRILNYSTITMQERTNAELYYLGKIAKEMAEVPETEEQSVLENHPRWAELCKVHGAPVVSANRNLEAEKQTLGRTLIEIEFKHNMKTIAKKIPKSITISALRGFVGILFGVKPLKVELELAHDDSHGVKLDDELRRLEFYTEDHKRLQLLVLDK
ncbi:hypothetical protein BDZ91DRAFT_844867 [Kalaharituber pfeilii]|nr:hypothetical protein BDZ91DRAFT_844867 [Kalaharituber pfeilii]